MEMHIKENQLKWRKKMRANKAWSGPSRNWYNSLIMIKKKSLYKACKICEGHTPFQIHNYSYSACIYKFCVKIEQ